MDTRAEVAGAAAELATLAPSIHNSQPWRWRIAGACLDLYLEHGRLLGITDPDRRLAILSCGAALHHAATALAAEGWHTSITRLPDPADPEHLARLDITGPVDASPDAMRHVQTIRLRHTDRRPTTRTPVDGDDLAAVAASAREHGAQLHLLSRDAVLDLAAAVSYAQRTEAAEEAWQAELAYWTGGTRPGGAGVPDTAIPETATRTTVPSRDFGHRGTLPISAEHDTAATFAILYGDQDLPTDWLRAGEALSAAWLTATELGVSVLPLSATVEVAATRATLRRLLAGTGEPYLVLRIGHADPDHPAAPHTPRLPVEQIIER